MNGLFALEPPVAKIRQKDNPAGIVGVVYREGGRRIRIEPRHPWGAYFSKDVEEINSNRTSSLKDKLHNLANIVARRTSGGLVVCIASSLEEK